MTTSNVNVERMDRLGTPDDYLSELPITPEATALVARARQDLENIMAGRDDRMAMLVGPCSIHDEKAGLEYAGKLAKLAERVEPRPSVVKAVPLSEPAAHVAVQPKPVRATPPAPLQPAASAPLVDFDDEADAAVHRNG